MLWFPVFFWCGIIFTFSSLQTNVINAPFNLTDFIIKKTAHITEFAILGIVIFRALYKTFNHSFEKNAYVTFIFSLIYAMSDEFHQRFVYGRTSRLRDVIIDGFGILLALYLIHILKNKKTKSKMLSRFKKFIFDI